MRLRLYPALLYCCLFALLLGGGVVNGLVNGRWAPATEEEAPQLDRLPLSIADWDGTAIDADPDNFPEEQVGNMLLRRYVRRSDGATVTLFLTAGRAGPIVSAHMPDSCYPGAGYQFVTPMTKRSIPAGPEGRTHEFRSATFSKTERALPLYVRIYWAWSATGEWRVPEHPRLTFAGQRWLYKLYVIRQLAQSSEPVDGDVAESFLQALTSQMEQVFFNEKPFQNSLSGGRKPPENRRTRGAYAPRSGFEIASRNGSVK
jgi:hypothetical protein